ncbi:MULTISPECIES: TlpA family protein disulfide reductase [Streptomyces]|uniref:Peroxiredoxin n=1 Tax=Streptomyces stelliscabiei TaxID=146820 RepID=A0A8I0P3B4_9ACTN|nr:MULTISPECIES: TlpA disulfide reductase family protein [Streptomyces]KND43986.1 redoxin [Streptomyces stelliscabiei]MBE1598678.1 peroxiredoxin [Streptomyces stelliscabiei]MDX2516530.1 TlpA disulfide reductase family protein [Streptomyces stelliscabiei]MDX2553588.1 TlpA disulfide reductase family protein [Streptomyces stelliscabiei]MDX2613436.1 TlpA disulfide reductase family protein [Streptomyces stelliscabiei]
MKTNARAGLCVLVVGLAMAGCATPKPLPAGVERAERARQGAGAGLFKDIPVAERPVAPDFAGTSVDGEPVRLSDFRGRVVVVNAWASTCGPCRAESPDLDRVQRKSGARGVQVLGVSADVSRSHALAFQRDLGLSYPSLHDPGGKQFLKLPKGLVNPRILPFTLFVDREGRIAGAVQSKVSEKDVRGVVTPLLKEG